MTQWLYPLAWEDPSLFQNLISEPKSHSDLEIERTSKYQRVKLPHPSQTPHQCVPIHGCPGSSLMPAGWGDPPHSDPPTHLLKVLRKKESAVAQSRPTLCDPVDCGLLGSSVHGISQARILEWVAISFSGRSPQNRDWAQISRIVGRCFTVWATREVLSLVLKPGLPWVLRDEISQPVLSGLTLLSNDEMDSSLEEPSWVLMCFFCEG